MAYWKYVLVRQLVFKCDVGTCYIKQIKKIYIFRSAVQRSAMQFISFLIVLNNLIYNIYACVYIDSKQNISVIYQNASWFGAVQSHIWKYIIRKSVVVVFLHLDL